MEAWDKGDGGMSDIVKVSWSGGKDSTAAELLHLWEGHHTKVVNYIPMFTDEIPLITKRHHEFILSAAERFEKMGAEVFFAKGRTYFDFVLHKCSKGPRKGKIYGFPCFLTKMCNFKEYSKVAALNKIQVGEIDYQDIGIAFDEIKRHEQLTEKKRSILVEKQIEEKEAFAICKRNGFISPHYDYAKRDGCGLCPQARESERKRWFEDYPKAFDIVRFLQNEVKKEYPEDIARKYPLRNKQWFIDEDAPIQLSLFDIMKGI